MAASIMSRTLWIAILFLISQLKAQQGIGCEIKTCPITGQVRMNLVLNGNGEYKSGCTCEFLQTTTSIPIPIVSIPEVPIPTVPISTVPIPELPIPELSIPIVPIPEVPQPNLPQIPLKIGSPMTVTCDGSYCACPLDYIGECTILCEGTADACKNALIECNNPGFPCIVDCIAENACSSDTNIYGPFEGSLTVNCFGRKSCEANTQFHGQTGTDLTVTCDGQTSCKAATFNFGNGAGTINCNGLPDACLSSTFNFLPLIAVEGMRQDSFVCNGLKCPENVPQPFVYTTSTPTSQPTTKSPTYAPTTKGPTKQPSMTPTHSPTTNSPTPQPTNTPTYPPSKQPSMTPSYPPTPQPSTTPTQSPTMQPITTPTYQPSTTPTKSPTNPPSYTPTMEPTTKNPTKQPSTSPTPQPTPQPSNTPTITTNPPTNQPIVSATQCTTATANCNCDPGLTQPCVIECDGASNACKDALIVCSNGYDCFVDCVAPESCAGDAVIVGPVGAALTVRCIGEKSCQGKTIIEAVAGTDLTVDCSGSEACKGSDVEFNFGSGIGQVFCSGAPDACIDTRFKLPTNAVAFQCIGNNCAAEPITFNNGVVPFPKQAPTTTTPMPIPILVQSTQANGVGQPNANVGSQYCCRTRFLDFRVWKGECWGHTTDVGCSAVAKERCVWDTSACLPDPPINSFGNVCRFTDNVCTDASQCCSEICIPNPANVCR